MKNFLIIHTNDHNSFKDFIKKKPGSMYISYIDLLAQQEKYILFGESKNNSVLACELFNKIYDSISNLHNPKYHSIFYYTDTLDCVILNNFIDTIEQYKSKLKVELEIKLCDLDNQPTNLPQCLNRERITKSISLVNKEYIQQIF